MCERHASVCGSDDRGERERDEGGVRERYECGREIRGL